VRSLVHLLRRASQRADLLFARESADLTPRQFAVLEAVSRNEGLTQSGIMDATGIDRSSTSDLVRRLVKDGSLQRRHPPGDARSYSVRLTAKGRQLLAAGAPADLSATSKLLALIPRGQRELFVKTLEHIALGEDDDHRMSR